jgi:hypothetical protein
MSIPDILGVLGFVLATSVILWGIWGYLRPLKMRVRGYEVTCFQRYRYLVSFQIVFQNLSSRNKHVLNLSIDYPKLLYGKISEPERSRIREDKDVLLVVDGNGNVSELPLDEVLQLPLDIPPHHIQSKVFPLLLTTDENDMGELIQNVPVQIGFSALNFSSRVISNCLFSTSIKTLTSEGLHSVN